MTCPTRLGGVALAMLASLATLQGQRPSSPPHRNILLFVADGLRHGSVNESDTPALWRVRTKGVRFANSHAVFPTFTMANASTMATGHGLGDTGIYSNTIRIGYSLFDTGNFKQAPGTITPFIENDQVLADLDDHFGGNVLQYDTLLAEARAHGYQTASIGKVGPAALQDVGAIAPVNRLVPGVLPGIIADDATGTSTGVPLLSAVVGAMAVAGVASSAPTRSNGFEAGSAFNNGNSGGTLAANVVQQDWFIDLATRFVLPSFAANAGKPFAMVFWSRDPDGTQHNNGDSLGEFSPGINGPTSIRGVRNADRALERLLAWLDAHPAIGRNTDVFVTSDHGFATISRTDVDAAQRHTTAESAKHDYVSSTGSVDTRAGTLPLGFLGLDLALDLHLNLFDPDVRPTGGPRFKKLRIGVAAGQEPWEHPVNGNALIAGDVQKADGSDARVIVAANGGSDLIYVPDGNADTVRDVVSHVLSYDYTGGVFVDDRYGPIPGTLPMSAINLVGTSRMPRPSVVVAFKIFYLTPDDLQSGIQIADTGLQQGQGMHGGFGRESTFNHMGALGPDFKGAYVDLSPVGNADIAPTLAHLMGFALPTGSQNIGRVLSESLLGGPSSASPPLLIQRSAPANGKATVVVYQEFGGLRYLDRGCVASPDVSASQACR